MSGGATVAESLHLDHNVLLRQRAGDAAGRRNTHVHSRQTGDFTAVSAHEVRIFTSVTASTFAAEFDAPDVITDICA